MGISDTQAAIGDVLTSQQIPAFFNGAPSTRIPPLAPNDNFGTSVTGLGDLDGDGVEDIAVGAPFDDDLCLDCNSGAVWIVFLNANGTVKTHAKIGANQLLDGLGEFSILNAGDQFGAAVANLGDLNGDGVTDIAVGAPGKDGTFSDQGAVYIIFLTSLGGVFDRTLITHNFNGFPASLGTIDRFGSAVAGLGDLDLDGIEDVMVGAPRDDDGGTDRGAAYILFLKIDGTVKDVLKVSDTSAGVNPTLQNLNQFGVSVTNLGDVDGNGVQDIAVGAPVDVSGGFDTGAVWVLFLQRTIIGRPPPFPPIVTVFPQSVQKVSGLEGGFTGDIVASDAFGIAVTGIGDLDGDGIPDMAVGAVGDDDGGSDNGAVWLLFLNTDGTVKRHQKISELSGGNVPNLEDGEQFGRGVAPVGDLDGDGGLELLVGSPFNDARLSNLPFSGSTPIVDAGVVRLMHLDVTPEADLQIVMTDGPDPVETGGLITYGITVTNQGPNAADMVVVSNPLPTGTTFASASAECAFNGGTVTCDLGTLLPQTDDQVQISLQAPTDPKILANTVNVSTVSNDSNSSNDSATASTVVHRPNATVDLELTMVSVMNPVEPNKPPPQSPSFQLTVTNHGPDVATGVQVTNNLPPGTLLQSVNPTQGLCQGSGPISCELGTMDINSSVIITVVLQQAPAGVYTNGAGVTADETDSNFTNNQAVAIVTVTSCTQTWKKSASGTDWFNSNNWGKAVPGAGDSVCIPEDANITPVLTASTSIQNLSLLGGENGTPGLTINAGVVLNVAGDVLALQAIDGSGSVQITQSSAMIQGTFPHLITENDVSLSGTTLVSGNLTIARGELRLGQQQLSVLGNLTTLVDSSRPDGALGMRHPTDRVTVMGNVDFQGGGEGRSGLLSAGKLFLKGNFNQSGVKSFSPSGSHATIFSGSGNQVIAFQEPVASFFQEVNVSTQQVSPSQRVALSTPLKILGKFRNFSFVHIPSGVTVSLPTGTFVNEAGAVLSGEGTIDGDVLNRGTIVPSPQSPPSPPAGPLPVPYPNTGVFTMKSLTLDPSSQLQMDLNGLAPVSEHDQVQVLEQANLGGHLEMQLGQGFSPPVGTNLSLITCNPCMGNFASQTDLRPRSDETLEPIVQSGAVNLVVNLVPVQSFDLTVQRNGSGGGSVASRPLGITCGPTCVKTFPQNTVVELVATPDGASQFNGWSGQGCGGSSPICTITMSQVRLVTASFCPLVGLCTVPQPPLGVEANLYANLVNLLWLPVGGSTLYNIYTVNEVGVLQLLTSVDGGQNFFNIDAALLSNVNVQFVVTSEVGGQESGFGGPTLFLSNLTLNPLIGWNQVDVYEEGISPIGTNFGQADWLCQAPLGGGRCDQISQTGIIFNPNDLTAAQYGTRLFTYPSQNYAQYDLDVTLKDDALVTPDGAMGLVFGVGGADPTQYYRLSMDKENHYRRLIQREGLLGEPSVLGEDTNFASAYLPGALYKMQVLFGLNEFTASISPISGDIGTTTFTISNPQLFGQGFGFYSSKNPGPSFEFLALVPEGASVSNRRQLWITQTGSGKGAVTSADMRISCEPVGGLCANNFDVGDSVVLTAAPESVEDTFEGWEVISDPLKGCDRTIPVASMENPLTILMDMNTCLQATFSGNPIPAHTMDIDNDGDVDTGDVQTIQRWMFGLREAALVEPLANSVGQNVRKDVQEVEAYLSSADSMLDVDMDGIQNVMADGNLFARFAAGLRGADLTSGVVNLQGLQPVNTEIEAHLFRHCAGMCGDSAAALTGDPEPKAALVDPSVESSGDPTDGPVSSAVTTEVVLVSQDSTIIQKLPHRNFGASSRLWVGGQQTARTVLNFDLSPYQHRKLVGAMLMLSSDEEGGQSKRIQLYRLGRSFVEGPGTSQNQTRATRKARRTGVTWDCAIDKNLRNRRSHCSESWDGGMRGARPLEVGAHSSSPSREVGFDVTVELTQMLLDGQSTVDWLVRHDREGQQAQISFYSREGALNAGVKDHAPKLLLHFADQ